MHNGFLTCNNKTTLHQTISQSNSQLIGPRQKKRRIDRVSVIGTVCSVRFDKRLFTMLYFFLMTVLVCGQIAYLFLLSLLQSNALELLHAQWFLDLQ